MQESTVGFWLSPQQKFAWKLRQEALKAASWPACQVRLAGALDAGRLRQALEHIVSRHEILRTVFRRKTGLKVPFQVVLDTGRVGFDEVDYSDLDEAERNLAIERLWTAENQAELTDEAQATLQAILIRRAEQDFLLLLMVHPLCADGASLRILVEELSRIYSGEENRLGESFRYLQFAQWQADLLEATDEEAQKGRNFWDKQLGASHPTLPYGRFEEGSGFTPKVLRTTISPATASVILERSDTSQFLLAAWESLIARLSGQSAFLVGFLADGREYEELEKAVGCFARTLPFSARVENDFCFADVLRQTAEWAREASTFEECFPPETIAMERELISFSYQDLSWQTTQGQLRFAFERLRLMDEVFQLRLLAVRRADELEFEFQYDGSRFEPAVVERLAGYYQNLLQAAVDNSEATIARFPLVPESERQQLIVEWNQTAAAYPQARCLHELFEEQAARVPERLALRSDDETFTYRELNERANQLAHYLRRQGVGPDRPVGVCVERGAEMIVTVLAIMKAGGAYVPLNPDNPPARTEQQLRHVYALIRDSRFSLPGFAGPTIVLDHDQENWASQPKSNPSLIANPENLVYVIYTSGSTGVPKGVAVRHRNLVNYAHFITRRLELEKFPQGLEFATVSTLSADLGNTCIFPALVSGGCLHVVGYETSTDPRRFADYLSKHPVDVLKIVPSHLQALLEAERAASLLPRRYLIFGGEALTKRLLEQIVSLAPNCEILNHYGPTETTVGSLTLKLKDYDWRQAKTATIPLGRPIANTQAYILDPNLELVPRGAVGELYIGGAGVTAGYLGQPDKTEERFFEDPFATDRAAKMYRTGDRARYLEDGNIEFLGRADDQVKIRGFRVELGEIQAILAEHPAVKQAVVVARADEAGDLRLLAYVVLHPATEQPRGEDFRSHLKQQLPDYMVPQAVQVLGKLPLTANGKIDRQALPEPELEASTRTYVAPRTEIETCLASIWAEVLRREKEKLGVEDNFFELGGHSLLATQVVSRIRERLSVEIPMRAIFACPTIAGLAEVIEQAQETSREAEEMAILPVAREAYRL